MEGRRWERGVGREEVGGRGGGGGREGKGVGERDRQGRGGGGRAG